MHIFDYSFLDEGLLPAEIVNLTATITAFNAISDTRKESNKSIYTELEKIARVQSVKGSNAIEGIGMHWMRYILSMIRCHLVKI